MSQEKVNYYKEQKANRSAIVKKEKRMLLIEKIVGALIAIGAIVWVGFSARDLFINRTSTENVAAVTTEMNVTALDDYLGTISE